MTGNDDLFNITSCQRTSRLSVDDLFPSDNRLVKICAPMVRYSKLAFRNLVKLYGCDIVYTPMIISDSFTKSAKARNVEFTTNQYDRPLIVQFASCNAKELADSAELVSMYCEGVDLNCGCPQRWAMSEGYGAHLIKHPELVSDMVRQTRSRLLDQHFCVSIKIRIHQDIRRTVDLCRQAELAGVSWITVHGRTTQQRTEPPDYEAIRTIKDSLGIPVVANGGIARLQDAHRVQEMTGVNAVMAANGMLQNPAMFAGYEQTPVDCIKDWVDIALNLGTPFNCFHHHLMWMVEKLLLKSERRIFNSLQSTPAVLDFLAEKFSI